MRCLECGAEFEARTVVQKYCSRRCRDRHKRAHDISSEWPSITFNCSQCGKEVTTEGGTGDKRTRFCCASCERKFWKHPHWENPSVRINFRSVEEYARYERRTNGEQAGAR